MNEHIISPFARDVCLQIVMLAIFVQDVLHFRVILKDGLSWKWY